MDFYQFVQWCFKSQDSGIATIIVIGVIGEILIRTIQAIRRRPNDDDE